MSDEKPSVDYKKSLESRKKQYELDMSEEVVFQVRDLRHARSTEVLDFCVQELSRGTTWRALRVKLGLGEYAHDNRWKTIRNRLTDCVLPKDEQEAVKALYNLQEYYLEKIDDLISHLDERIEGSRGAKNEVEFFNAKVKALQVAMERQERKIESFLRMRKLQLDDAKNQGPSIIFQNNFHIPRPGDKQELVGTARNLLSQVLGNPIKEVKEASEEGEV